MEVPHTIRSVQTARTWGRKVLDYRHEIQYMALKSVHNYAKMLPFFTCMQGTQFLLGHYHFGKPAKVPLL